MTCGYCWAPDFKPVQYGSVCVRCGSSYHYDVNDPLVMPDTYAGKLLYPPK